MKRFLLAALLSLTAPGALAAEPALPDADPALWVVKDEDTTIYLFGTFHMLDGKTAWFNDEVKQAFDASQEVVVEAKIPEDPNELQPLILKYAVDPAGKTLSSKLTPEVAEVLKKELNAVGAPAAAFDMFEPWFVSVTLATLKMQSLGLKAENGPEKLILAQAKAANKPVTELEGLEYQLKLFDEIPEEQQIVYLTDTLKDLGEMNREMPLMAAAWAAGDAEKLAEMLNASVEDDPQLYDRIFTRRNADWADWIGKRMERPGTVFLAVGAGHLAGKSSVQDLLAARRIVAERVRN